MLQRHLPLPCMVAAALGNVGVGASEVSKGVGYGVSFGDDSK